MKMLMAVYSGVNPQRVSSLLDRYHAGGYTELRNGARLVRASRVAALHGIRRRESLPVELHGAAPASSRHDATARRRAAAFSLRLSHMSSQIRNTMRSAML